LISMTLSDPCCRNRLSSPRTRGTGGSWSLDMSMMADGTLMMAGYGSSGRNGCDILVGRMDVEGKLPGSRTFGGENDDISFSTVSSIDGPVIA